MTETFAPGERTRLLHSGEKVRTCFGAVFVHADIGPDGRIESVALSHAARHKETGLGDALETITDAINRAIETPPTPDDYARLITEAGRFDG